MYLAKVYVNFDFNCSYLDLISRNSKMLRRKQYNMNILYVGFYF